MFPWWCLIVDHISISCEQCRSNLRIFTAIFSLGSTATFVQCQCCRDIYAMVACTDIHRNPYMCFSRCYTPMIARSLPSCDVPRRYSARLDARTLTVLTVGKPQRQCHRQRSVTRGVTSFSASKRGLRSTTSIVR